MRQSACTGCIALPEGSERIGNRGGARHAAGFTYALGRMPEIHLRDRLVKCPSQCKRCLFEEVLLPRQIRNTELDVTHSTAALRQRRVHGTCQAIASQWLAGVQECTLVCETQTLAKHPRPVRGP